MERDAPRLAEQVVKLAILRAPDERIHLRWRVDERGTVGMPGVAYGDRTVRQAGQLDARTL
jgi:hypothetical protein